jgi:xanthosine utilization system XapX-like protein
MTVIGILCGVLWWALVEPSQLVRLQDAVGQDELGLSRDFSATGWYTVIALVAGLLSGLLFGFLRRRDPLVTLLLVLAGCCVAAVLMQWTGYLLGPDDPASMLQDAAVGTRADAPLELHGTLIKVAGDLVVHTAYLAWPIGALVGLLIPLLSRTD